MTRLVVLRFSGSLESGFLVNSEIGLEGKSADRGCAGALPPAKELKYCLDTWQQHYKRLGSNQRIKPQQIIYNGSSDPYRYLIQSAQKLQQALLLWLDSHSFSPIDKHLREELNRAESARILICSDRPEIYQLPWCCWDLLESYPNLEIAVSSPNFARIPATPKLKRHQKVRILAILGDSEGINLDADRVFLDTLDTGEVKFLVEPTIPELYNCLWYEAWDIVFFAGHSRTLKRQGILYLNPQDRLTIEQLKYGFRQAIASGLKLAIFNSCDGLGLAEELGQLSLPQSIVMRLPIPDEMAQQFVKYFLQAYAGGDSLYSAMRKAREHLQSQEKQFPCASWLPVIYQNPAVTPPRWSDFRYQNLFSRWLKFRPGEQSVRALASIAVISTVIVWLLQFWGLLQPGELNAYDRLMVFGYDPPVEQKVLIVTVDDLDIIYQRSQRMSPNMRGSLADPALDLLLQKLNLGGAKAIALDIIHDFPFVPKLAQTIAQTDNFVAICRVRNLPNLVSIAPPLLKRERVGFSNWAIDNDGSIRRQIVGMSPDDVCNTSFSLSLRLALMYLGDVPTKFDSQSPLEIGGAVFPQLQTFSGGYRLPEAQGYQILLNYRQALPATVSLREILTMPQADVELLVKNKIVLIGVTGHNQDLHHTPYSKGEQAKRFSGVMIHALMTSQIVDVVLGEQKLLYWASSPLEMLWTTFWSAIGATIIFLNRRSPVKIMFAIMTALALLLIGCWLCLIDGIWLLTIAPALGLIIAATLALAYSRK